MIFDRDVLHFEIKIEIIDIFHPDFRVETVVSDSPFKQHLNPNWVAFLFLELQIIGVGFKPCLAFIPGEKKC